PIEIIDYDSNSKVPRRASAIFARHSGFPEKLCGTNEPPYNKVMKALPPSRPRHRRAVNLMGYAQLPGELKRRLNRDALRSSPWRDQQFYKIIRTIPKGRVSTYGKVAAAAGFPLYHRAVAKFLRGELSSSLPWQRIVGAGGEIKLRG